MSHRLKQFIKNATAFIETETGSKGILAKAKDSLESLDIGQAKDYIDLVLAQVEQLKTNISEELKDLIDEDDSEY